MKSICNANIEVLRQLEELISCAEPCYVRQSDSAHAGIGEHVRHVLDHYRALQIGLPTQHVDYNFRTRQSLEETQPDVARKNIATLIGWLNQIEFSTEINLTVVSEINLHHSESTKLSSNVERELLYLINHSIHHMAYASLLASTQGVSVPSHIGLAPGTATYQREIQKETNLENS